MNHAPKEFAHSVVQKLTDAGFEALWAGGCVRDQLLGIEPNDYDVATSATPEQVRELFGKRRTLPIGMSFGVVVVLSGSKQAGQIEVATFRTDQDYSDGRRPDAVVYSTAREDAQRRDFTINGMFFDPLQDKLVDYVEGQADLKTGVIRAIGVPEKRIAEDRLRMLRAIRFAARFGFTIDPATLEAIQDNAEHVSIVSGERIAEELRKTFQTPHAAGALEQLAETRLLDQALPLVAGHWPQRGPIALALLARNEHHSWLVKLSLVVWAIVDSCPQRLDGLLDNLKERLKFANQELSAIRFAVSHQPQLANAPALPWSQAQPLLQMPHLQTGLALLSARGEASAEPGDSSQQDSEQLSASASWISEQLQRPAADLDPQPLLTGNDLIALGLKPGAAFRELLATIRQMQLDGQLHTQQEATAWVRQQP